MEIPDNPESVRRPSDGSSGTNGCSAFSGHACLTYAEQPTEQDQTAD